MVLPRPPGFNQVRAGNCGIKGVQAGRLSYFFGLEKTAIILQPVPFPALKILLADDFLVRVFSPNADFSAGQIEAYYQPEGQAPQVREVCDIVRDEYPEKVLCRPHNCSEPHRHGYESEVNDHVGP